MNEIAITTIQGTGYFQNPIRKTLEQGKLAPEVREVMFQNKMKEEEKRIQPIYNSRGKIIEEDISGRRLNMLV
jgi:hypothetical protein